MCLMQNVSEDGCSVVRSAGDDTRHLRSSSSEILAVGKRKVSLRVACWNVKTMLRAGKLENIKEEMKRLKINILGGSTF